MQYKVPPIGSDAWKRALLSALDSPNFKLSVNVSACERRVEPKKKKTSWGTTVAEVSVPEARGLNSAKDFLLELKKNEK